MPLVKWAGEFPCHWLMGAGKSSCLSSIGEGEFSCT